MQDRFRDRPLLLYSLLGLMGVQILLQLSYASYTVLPRFGIEIGSYIWLISSFSFLFSIAQWSLLLVLLIQLTPAKNSPEKKNDYTVL